MCVMISDQGCGLPIASDHFICFRGIPQNILRIQNISVGVLPACVCLYRIALNIKLCTGAKVRHVTTKRVDVLSITGAATNLVLALSGCHIFLFYLLLLNLYWQPIAVELYM